MNRLAGPEVEAAISALYDRYGRTVFGVGLNFLGDRSLAEDLVQEVFLKGWRSSHTFDASRSSFSTWLYRVTRSAASDMHRKRARNVRQMPDGDPHFAALRDATPGPQEVLDDSWLSWRVSKALEGLGETHREVIELAVFPGPLATGDLPADRRAAGHRQDPHFERPEAPARGARGPGRFSAGHAMRCAEARLSIGAFVLGGLEPQEEGVIRRHLASCPGCRAELREIEEVNVALQAAPPLAAPPDHLRNDILSRVRGAGPSSSGAPLRKNLGLILPAAAALVAVAALALFLRSGLPVATVQLIPVDTREEYWGVAEIHPRPLGNQLVKLRLNNLDEPEPGSFYQMWFVSGGQRISAGTFTAEPEGTEVWLTVPPEARGYRTLLITEQSASVGDAAGGAVLTGQVTPWSSGPCPVARAARAFRAGKPPTNRSPHARAKRWRRTPQGRSRRPVDS